MEQMSEMQRQMDKCTSCKRTLPPGTPCNKGYDDELGSWTMCTDCVIKANVWYLRKLFGKDKK